MLKIGDLFPKEFELENQNGELITNENYGRKNNIIFLPTR